MWTLKFLQGRGVVGDGKWLRVGEVADILGVSLSTARNYIDGGVFPHVRRLPHGDRRVLAEDVHRVARQMQQGTTPAQDGGESGQQPS